MISNRVGDAFLWNFCWCLQVCLVFEYMTETLRSLGESATKGMTESVLFTNYLHKFFFTCFLVKKAERQLLEWSLRMQIKCEVYLFFVRFFNPSVNLASFHGFPYKLSVATFGQ